MVNQELLEYIKGQLGLGVSRDAIRSALLGAGWQQADIEGAFASASGQPAQAAQPQAVQPVADVQRTASPSVTPTENKTISADFFQSKSSEIFSPTVSSSVKPEIKRDQQVIQVSQPHPLKMVIAVSVLGLAVLVLGGLYAMAFIKSGNLQTQIDELTSGKTTSDTQLAEVRRGTTDKDQQITNLKASVDDLNMQFDFLIPGTSSVRFALSGKLGTSTQGYWLRTSKGIVLNLKNGRDAKIDANLKGSIGFDINITGTHFQGSKDVILTGVNGIDVSNMVPPVAATSTASSSLPAPKPATTTVK